MSDRQKSIVAAVLAVHTGRMSPDEAARLLEEPGSAPTLAEGEDIPTVSLVGDDGSTEVASLIDVLDDPAKQAKALKQAGLDEDAQQTLFQFGSDSKVVRDTLKTITPASRDDYAGSNNLTQAPQKNSTLRLTTGHILPGAMPQSERYEVHHEHARGGMGRVMLARDLAVGREVALKELLPGIATGSTSIPGSVPNAGTNESGGVVERFLREAKITGQLEHPNIIPVYEIGQYEDGNYYYTMRFVRGKTLADKLRDIRKDDTLDRDAKLAARIKLLDMFVDVCNAIAYAHSKGVIHRDIKPENIMIGDYGETLVLDWGLARIKGQEDKAFKDLKQGTLALSKSLYEGADSDALTVDGSIVGTPAYMAPEQARGEIEQVDEQSDVYALGAVLYQILTGSPPYEGPMAALIVQAVLAGPPIRVRSRERNVPPELEALVEHAMAREKEDRLKSAYELAREVKAFRDGRTIGSYQYSVREMVARFVHQHRATVAVGMLALLVIVTSAIIFVQTLALERDAALLARQSAESEHARAQSALDEAERERLERERLEREQQEREQREFAVRANEAERLLNTIEGMRVEPAVQDLSSRLAHYEAELEGPPARAFLELAPEEQIGNGVLISSVLGYVSALQNLLDLLSGPAGVSLPDAFRGFDIETERERLSDLRVRTGRLARINGDFTLAEFLIAGAAIPSEQLQSERNDIERARTAMLQLQADRIDAALLDVRSGIGRDGRPPDAPSVDEYVLQLSQYREVQTVAMLEPEVTRLLNRRDRWGRNDILLLGMICRVLGKVEQSGRTVPLLTRLLDSDTHHDVRMAASRALTETQSSDALEVLLKQIRSSGLDYWDELRPHMGSLALPSRLRNPEGLEDKVAAAIAALSRGRPERAIALADGALEQRGSHAEALLVRGLAHIEMEAYEAAQADLKEAIRHKPDFYDAYIALARARDIHTDGDRAIEDLTRAIELQPENHSAYMHRARAHLQRAGRPQARADYERAIELVPDRIEVRIEYGMFLRSLGRPHHEEAREQFTQVIEMAPDDYRGWSYRCMINRDMSFGQCLTDGREATRLNPNDARAYRYMAQALYGLSRHTEAIEAATNAIRNDPDDGMSYYYRAITNIQVQLGQDGIARNAPNPGTNWRPAREAMVERIVSDFQAAVRINPRDFRSWALMADQLLVARRHAEAREAYIKALELAPFGGLQLTIGMGNEHVRQGLRECRGAELAESNPRQLGDIAMVVHYFAGMAQRPIPNPEHLRSAMRWVARGKGVDAASASEPELYEFHVAMVRVIDLLQAQGYHQEAVELSERHVGSHGFVLPEDHVRHAALLLGLARQYQDMAFVVLGTDEDQRAERLQELEGLPWAERRDKIQSLTEQAFEALGNARKAGFRDHESIRREVERAQNRFAQIQRDERFDDWLYEVETSDIEPFVDPGQPLELLGLTNVAEGAPAWQAGLRAMDCILSVDGQAVRTTAEFMQIMQELEPGQEFTLQVRRYALDGGRLVRRTDDAGEPVLDEMGVPVWSAEEIEVTIRRGFLGVGLDTLQVPSPLYP
jgi:serine/threonine protein kinase/Tfp pilus assembly protein PilF